MLIKTGKESHFLSKCFPGVIPPFYGLSPTTALHLLPLFGNPQVGTVLLRSFSYGEG